MKKSNALKKKTHAPATAAAAKKPTVVATAARPAASEKPAAPVSSFTPWPPSAPQQAAGEVKSDANIHDAKPGIEKADDGKPGTDKPPFDYQRS